MSPNFGIRPVTARKPWGELHKQSTYQVSTYRRPLLKRMTPLSWFIVVLVVSAIVVGAAVLVSRAAGSQNGTESLKQYLASHPLPTSTIVKPQATQAVVAANATSRPAVRSALPTVPPVPTLDPNVAPWANQLIKQVDGSLMAPKDIVSKAVDDLSEYYAVQRDLSVDDFMAKRDELLTTYFTGSALQEMRTLETHRQQYGVNRAGRFSIEIQRFGADGLSASAGVVLRDWVNDVYDVATRQLLTKGKLVRDTLTIMTVQYDLASGRWKFATIDDVTELN